MRLPPIDYHIHTVYSGHSAPDLTVRDIVEQADRLGLSSIAITEHAFYGLMAEANMEQIRGEVSVLRPAVEVFVGIEMDPDYDHKGRLVFEEFNKGDLSPVLVSTHAYPGLKKGWHEKLNLTAEEKRKIYMEWFSLMEHLVENPLVDVLAHPGRLITQNGIIVEFNGEVLKDFDRLFTAAKEKGVAIELNESLLGRFATERLAKSYLDVIRLGLAKGLKISIGSDAHNIDNIAQYPNIRRVQTEIGLLPEHIYYPGT